MVQILYSNEYYIKIKLNKISKNKILKIVDSTSDDWNSYLHANK